MSQLELPTREKHHDSSPRRLSFHRRSKSNASSAIGVDDILFPKAFEDEWALSDARDTDLVRARFFMVRFANLNPDPLTSAELVSIAGNQQLRTVPAVAFEVQVKIFGGRHGSFATTPLLQCIRFLLIKTRVAEVMVSPRTRSVIDFYFDPTMARNLEKLPKDTVLYKYPTARLKVAIVGGGPTALASAISLAEKGEGKIEVHMYEKRWVVKSGTNGYYIDYPEGAVRRDQVVTLQDSVTSLLSKGSYEALFQGRPECVWPGSANLQIRKVEDRFLKRCQDREFQDLIHLHPSGVSRDDLQKIGDFHVLLGADGAASWLRKSYFQGYEKERGRSFALGLAFNRPAGLPWSQPVNVFLTLSQTRYLLNASDFDGRGYLNMQLTEEEWDKMVALDGQPVTFGHPGCLRNRDGTVPAGFKEGQVFAPSMDRETPLWTAISDGLKLFGFKENEVINVVRIPIVVQAVREGVQKLPIEDSGTLNRPHALVAVAGDAAMTVHFWPGRGLNSGIKSGIALGDEMVHALNSGKFIGLQLSAMKEYNDFILKLQGREHDKRSIPILNQSGSPEMLGWLLSKAHTVPDEVAIEWLIGAMTQIAERLETRPDWGYKPEANVEPQLRIILRQLQSMTLREMAVSFPWPTREMAGAEVLPIRSMAPKEKKKWVDNLFTMLREDRSRTRARSTSGASSGRFEAPRQGRSKSPVPAPAPAPAASSALLAPSPSMSRSNAVRTPSVRATSPGLSCGRNLTVPSARGLAASEPPLTREPSPTGDISLGRLLSVSKRPGREVLADAMSLALFRVDEDAPYETVSAAA